MTESADRRAAGLGALAAFVIIANQVGGKATRDALFLTHFDVSRLPLMLAGSSLLSLVVVLWMSGVMQRRGPSRVIPFAFQASALIHLLEWGLYPVLPRLAVVLVYLHLASFGAVLISGFWSLVSERFDPRAAKRAISRCAAGATLGGLAGGVLAERVAALLAPSVMLVIAAALHFLAGVLVTSLRNARQPARSSRSREALNPLATLGASSYLQTVAALVALGTIGAAFLDYAFKEAASSAFTDDGSLLRFFAAYYTLTSLVTFVVQSLFARRFVERLGLAASVGSLPFAVAIGGVAGFLVPGLWSVVGARGSESVIRSSIYRSGYELLFSPLSAIEKRASKTIVDVGFDRIGDVLGGLLTAALIAVAADHERNAVLIGALVTAIMGLALSWRLRTLYVQKLESRLVEQGEELGGDEDLSLSRQGALLASDDSASLSDYSAFVGSVGLKQRLRELSSDQRVVPNEEPDTGADAKLSTGTRDLLESIRHLRSSDRETVESELRRNDLDPDLLLHILPLLAWDEVSEAAQHAVAAFVGDYTGTIIDRLLDPDESFAVRRRLPRVLAEAPTVRAIPGLIEALEDRRFEVRYQVGRALLRIHERHPEWTIAPDTIFDTIEREVSVDRHVWEGRKLLDEVEDDTEQWQMMDRLLRNRANRSLEHVFRLLSLVLPADPLRISYAGIHSDDAHLRGTALEYLESVLPARVRNAIWPFLDAPPGSRGKRTPSEALERLMASSSALEDTPRN